MMNSIADKICNGITVLAFLVVIFAPLVFLDTKKTKSTLENKMLARFPALKQEGGKINPHLIKRLDAYFGDRLGFKEEAILLDVFVSYRCLKKIKHMQFMEGAEQELFLNKDVLQTFQAKPVAKEVLMQCCANIDDMRRFFEQNGSRFYMVTIPFKENVYPELYPTCIRRFSDKTFFDRLGDHLNVQSDIRHLHLKNALVAKKQEKRVYYKNYDTNHWNMNGAMVGYQELMKMLSKEYPNMEILQEDDFEITVRPSEGALVAKKGLDILQKTFRLEDNLYDWKLKRGYQSRRSDIKAAGIVFDVNVPHYHYVNPSKKDAPKILIFGDSYFYLYLLPTLAESFSELHFILNQFVTDKTKMDELVKLHQFLSPDIVVFQNVEWGHFTKDLLLALRHYRPFVPAHYEYADLAVKNERPHMWLQDRKTGKLLSAEIEISDEREAVLLKGAVQDHLAKQSTAAVYAKVGERYYKADPFAWERFAKEVPGYLNSGVTFRIPAKALCEAGEVSFIAISHDKSYRYASVTMKVRTTEPVVAANKENKR